MNTEFEDFRMGHLVRTAQVWKRMVELGATEESKIDFDFTFTTNSKSNVEVLKKELADYPLEVNKEGLIKKTFTISGNSGPITWTEEQLLKWVDFLIDVGYDTGCEFDGCGGAIG